MKFDDFLDIVSTHIVFTTDQLAELFDIRQLRLQLSRWMAAGKVTQLRRGVYCLATLYQKEPPHPFLIANLLQCGSAISLHSALAHHGLIRESPAFITSVSSLRSETLTTSLGAYTFRHIQPAWLHGYQMVQLTERQWVNIATPEKALLDLAYLEPGGDSLGFLLDLRLHGVEQLHLDELHHLAQGSGKPKIMRAAKVIREMTESTWEGELG